MGRINSFIRFLRNGKNADVRYETLRRKVDEIIFANKFRDTVNGCQWFPEGGLAITPGVGAVGYPFLLALFRVLDAASPRHILELGLGQSTRLIGQYALTHWQEDFFHFVIEHDRDFIEHFEKLYSLEKSTIIELILVKEELPKDSKCFSYKYKDFNNNFGQYKYDLIVIDGPYGFGNPEYSRIDILGILPECIEDRFCIIIDDYDRKAEKDTVDRIEYKLKNSNISFNKSILSGEKDVCILVSENNRYLTYL